jgi:hypothetical protein
MFLLVLAGLGLVAFVALLVTDWGDEGAAPLPGTGRSASPRPEWKTRVGYVLWAGVSALVIAGLAMNRWLGDVTWGDELGYWAVGLALIAVWWEAGRIQRSGLRIALRSILVVTTIVALLVILIAGMYMAGCAIASGGC